MGRHSKVSPSTEWRLGENSVLRPMECLTPTVEFDIFLTITVHLGVNNIRVTGVLKNVTALQLGRNSWKKRNVATLNNAHQAKKQYNFDSGQLEQQQRGLHSFF